MNTSALVSRLDHKNLPQWTPASPGYIGMQSSADSDAARQASRMSMGLRRYWWVAALIWAVIAIPATFAIFKMVAPQYVAMGSINVQPYRTNLLTNEDRPTPFYMEYLRTQADLMKNPNILHEAAKKPALNSFDWFRNLPDQVGYLMDNVQVEAIPSTQNIRISMTHKDPAAAKAIVNAVMDAYMEDTDTRQKKRNEDALKQLLDLQKTQVEAQRRAQADLDNVMKEGDVSWNEGFLKSVGETIANTQITLAKLQSDKFALDNQLKNIQEKELDDEETYRASVPVDQDQQIMQWSTELIRVQTSDSIAESKKQTASHPDRVSNRKQIKDLQKQITDRKKAIQDNAWKIYKAGFELDKSHKVNSLQSDVDAINKQIAKYGEDLKTLTASARDMGSKSQPIATFKAQIETSKDMLKHYEARIDEVTKQNSPLGKLDPYAAVLPLTPTVDKRPKLAAAVNGAGFMLGMAVLVLLIKLRDKIDHTEDLPHTFQPLVVGTVSHAGSAARGLQGRMSKKILGEEMRLLHANLLPPGPMQRRIMMITSPTPSNGKTSIASQLALSLAKSGLDVLLIDADLRKRDLSTMFDVGFRPGLADLLQGRPPELIRPVELLPNLRLMGAGTKLDRNPVELFQRKHFHESLNLLQEKFDCIVVDTPPTLVVADARLIARSADEVLCVVRAQVSSPKDVNQTIDALSRITGKTPKIILNGVAHKQSYYKYKFAYSSEEHDAAEAAASADSLD